MQYFFCVFAKATAHFNTQWKFLFSLSFGFFCLRRMRSRVFKRQVKEDNSAKHAEYAGSETSRHAQRVPICLFLFVVLMWHLSITIIINTTLWRWADIRTDQMSETALVCSLWDSGEECTFCIIHFSQWQHFGNPWKYRCEDTSVINWRNARSSSPKIE